MRWIGEKLGTEPVSVSLYEFDENAGDIKVGEKRMKVLCSLDTYSMY
jgi:hypothetical protein